MAMAVLDAARALRLPAAAAFAAEAAQAQAKAGHDLRCRVEAARVEMETFL